MKSNICGICVARCKEIRLKKRCDPVYHYILWLVLQS